MFEIGKIYRNEGGLFLKALAKTTSMVFGPVVVFETNNASSPFIAFSDVPLIDKGWKLATEEEWTKAFDVVEEELTENINGHYNC